MYFETHVNFFSYGSFGGLKSNFGGHDIHHHDNIYTYINEGFHVGGSAVQEKGHNNMFSTMMVTMVLGKYVQEMVNSLCMITKSILPMVKLPNAMWDVRALTKLHQVHQGCKIFPRSTHQDQQPLDLIMNESNISL